MFLRENFQIFFRISDKFFRYIRYIRYIHTNFLFYVIPFSQSDFCLLGSVTPERSLMLQCFFGTLIFTLDSFFTLDKGTSSDM